MAPKMETYVLVRPMPGVGASTAEEVKALAQRSNSALRECQGDSEEHHIKWITSYLTDDVLVCVYKASDEQVLREHASLTGIPAGDILVVRHVASPSTANEPTAAESLGMASAHLSGVELPTPQREAAQAARHAAR